MKPEALATIFGCLGTGMAWAGTIPPAEMSRYLPERTILVQSAPPAEEPQKPYARARVRVNCAIDSKESHWSARQGDGAETELFSIVFPGCTYVVTDTGVKKLNLRTEITLNPVADIKQCFGFSAAFLFRVTVDGTKTNVANLIWQGEYVVSDRLSVTNLYGQTINLERVQIYEPATKASEVGPLQNHLFPIRPSPAFDEYFAGNIELLTEDGSSGFSRELFRNTPISSQVKEGNWDVDVTLKVDIFNPKGWCYSTDGAGKIVLPPKNLKFVKP